MNIGTLKKIAHTLKDWELKELRRLIGNSELTKQHLITMELARRRTSKYTDQTLDPRISIRSRLQAQ